MFWGKQRSTLSPSRPCCSSFSVSVLNFATSPNSGVKYFWGFLRSEKFILGFFFLVVYLFLGFFSSATIARRSIFLSTRRSFFVRFPVLSGGAAVGGVCPPPSLFGLFLFWAAGGVCGFRPGRVVPSWCPPLPFPVLGLLVSVRLSPLVWAAPMFARHCSSGVCVGVSGMSFPLVGRCSRLGVADFGRAVPSVLSGWGVCLLLVEWVRGFAAVCLSLAPPPFLCCLFVFPPLS